MKHSLLLLHLLVFFSALKAQSYHPMPASGGQWNVTRCWYFYPGGWHDEYAISLDGTDTIINHHIYKKLFIQIHHAPGTEFDSTYTHFLGAMREADKQVFFISEYQCIDTIERMVYDFNDTYAGDTIYTQVLTNGLTQTIPHIVTSVDSVLVGEEFRRRINMTDESGYFTESWTEGVGSSLGLTYATYWLLTDNSYDLNCFYDEDALKYINPTPAYLFCSAPLPDIHCSLTTSLEPGGGNQNFVIFPNPTHGEFSIESTSPIHAVTITNDLGKIIWRCAFEDQMDVSFLPPGVYFVQIKDAHDRSTGIVKMVKI